MLPRTATCEDCGALLEEAPGTGLCAKCVVGASTRLVSPLRVMPPPVVAEGGAGLPGHEVLEVIGTGGMGAVHRARQESLARDVAVKIIRAEHADAEDTERFLREARVLAQLDHPNIVPIYDSGTDAEGRCFYTMKMVRGRTLKAILLAVGKGAETWTLERLLEIFRKVCDAVAFAHARGVLHRDLKPDNIMVGEFGEVLVMDWGLAKVMGKSEDEGRRAEENAAALDADFSTQRVHESSALRPPPSDFPPAPADFATMYGVVLGTPQYMSPEQADARADLDARCDVYMLGGLLYTILTLRPPVRTGTLAEMLESVRTGRLDPVEFVPDFISARPAPRPIPPALAAVVRKAMALDRAERFPTVGAFAADVDAHLAGYATSAEHIGPAGQLWLLINRHRTVAGALLVLLLVSAGFVVQLIASERRATSNADLAQRNEHAARNSQARAQESAAAAQASEAATRTALARTNIALADSAYAGNDARQMRKALDDVPADVRDSNVNWHYLHDRADERQSRIEWEGDSFFIGSAPHPLRPGVFTVARNGTSRHNIQLVTYEAATGKVLSSFSHFAHSDQELGGGWVRGVAYSPDGRFIALGRIQGGDLTVHRAEDGAELARWPAGGANALAFLPDGKRLLQSADYSCRLWEAGTGRELWRSPHGSAHLLLPGGERIATVDENILHLLAVEDGRVLATYPLKGALPLSASVSPDGALLVFAKANGQLAGLRLADGTTAFETPGGESGAIQRTGFTPDGQRLITVAAMVGGSQSVQLRDVTTGSPLRQLRGGAGNVESMSIHPLSGDVLIAGSQSASWALPPLRAPRWQLVSAEVVGGFLGGDDLFLAPETVGGPLAAIDLRDGAACWQPSQRATIISTTSADGLTGALQLVRYGPKAGHEYLIVRAGGDAIREVATAFFRTDARYMTINADGSRLAVSAAWFGLEVFDTATGDSLRQIDNEFDIRSTAALGWHGTDARRLIGLFTRFGFRGNAPAEEWIVSWDTATGQRAAAMRHDTAMNCFAAEPGGTRLAEAGDDKLVRIRDAGTFAVLTEFRAHDGAINAIAWNPKRPVIATGSSDRSVRLWNVETGELIDELHIGLREPSALFFSPSGRRLACVTPGEKTLIWELAE